MEKSNRLGLKGFNKRYARKGEMSHALEAEKQRRKLAEAEVKELGRKTLTPRDWKDCLHQVCLNGDDQMLVINLVRVMKYGDFTKESCVDSGFRELNVKPTKRKQPSLRRRRERHQWAI